MYQGLDTLIRLILLACAVVGAVLLCQGIWKSIYAGLRRAYYGANQRRILRVTRGFGPNTQGEETEWLVAIQIHLENLLQATIPGSKLQNVPNFVVLSGSVGFGTFLISYSVIHRLELALVPAVLALFTPYFVLLIRRYHLSINNSYEIVQTVTILLPAYRRADRSMKTALNLTLEQLPPGPIRRAFGRLIDRLSDYETPDEARRALQRFVSNLGTSWAVQIANDIEHALLDGIDVEKSLIGLNEEMREIQDALKAQKLDRSDSLMVSVAPFLIWPLLMQYFYLKLSDHIYYYQFDTPQGFRWFMYTLVCTVGSLLVGVIFYKPKQDI